MALLKRVRVLAAKVEATSGTAETLLAAQAAINAYDVEIQGEIEFIERPRQGSFGRLPGVLGPRGGKCTFKTDLYGDGAAGVPLWASTFLPACGFVDSGGVFSPTSEPPGSNVKTATIGVYENGLLKKLRGAAGTFKLMFPTGKPAFIEWEFTGVWVAPTDAAILAPTYPTIIPLRTSNATFTIASWAPCFESLEIDAGNNVILRECATSSDGSGYAAGLVTDRKPVGKVNPEAALVATKDNYGLWIAGTEEALSIALTDGTDTITVAAPKAQRVNVQEGDRNMIQTDEIDFQCNASAGDDELTITFA